MLFNSLAFLLFFSTVAVGYFFLTMRIARRHKALGNTLSQIFLLAASLFFYGYWNISYLALILISVIITWGSGLLMEGRKIQEKRLILAGSLIINLGILFFFKYYGFFTDTVGLLSRGGIKFPAFDVLLPVGISFYTFQALGYSIDIYYGKVQAERNLVTYALFVTFFPGLMAGPIERTKNLLPQFKANYEFNYDRVTSGLRLAAWGMFKKVVIADQLAVYVSAVFGNPGLYPASSLALALFFFAFQVYCDFSGYSDIAIGCARVLGFKLMTNFRQPYLSRSISEYWQRWHISLATWLKDYIYIPLGGNRKGRIRQDLNLMIIFLVCGIWHGAAWTYVVFGAIHGMYLIVGKGTAPLRNAIYQKIGLPEESRLRKAIQICCTFLLVNFTCIIFRAKTITDSLLIMAKLTKLPAELIGYVQGLSQIGIIGTVRNAFQLGEDVAAHIADFGLIQFGISLILIFILIMSDVLLEKVPEGTSIALKLPLVLRWAGYCAIILVLLLRWNAGTIEFIYFAF
jgi:D-alanyl-lipoteichoic acid acyltransferase DltB (MBOAT superfamily)